MLPLFYTNNLRAFSKTHTPLTVLVKDIQRDSVGKPITRFIIKFKLLLGFSNLFARPATIAIWNTVNIYLCILR